MALYDRLKEIEQPVFLNTERWGSVIEFVPKSDYANRQPIDAVVLEDALPGTNENPGDGVTLNRPTARRTRESVTVHTGACLDIQAAQPVTNPDAFIIDDKIYAVKRIIGSDPAGMEMLCVRTDENTLRNYTKVG